MLPLIGIKTQKEGKKEYIEKKKGLIKLLKKSSQLRVLQVKLSDYVRELNMLLFRISCTRIARCYVGLGLYEEDRDTNLLTWLKSGTRWIYQDCVTPNCSSSTKLWPSYLLSTVIKKITHNKCFKCIKCLGNDISTSLNSVVNALVAILSC